MNLEKMRREFIAKRYGKVELSASDALALVDDLMKAEEKIAELQSELSNAHARLESMENTRLEKSE
jgi:uncharacterized protein YlxW (UPF0749 family)